MRLLIAAPYYLPYVSGMTMHVKRLAEGLAKRGHEVTVLTTRHSRDLLPEEDINGVTVRRTPVLFGFDRGAFSPSFFGKFAELIRECDAANVHVPMFEAGILASVAKHRRKRLVVTYHCDLSVRSMLAKPVELLYYMSVEHALERAHAIVVNTLDYFRVSRMRRFAWNATEIVPPIDMRMRREPDAAFRKRHHIPRDAAVIGFLGRLTREKGLSFLVDAMPRVLSHHPNAFLVIAGEGEAVAGGTDESVQADLQEQAAERNVEDRVRFTGFIPENEKNSFYSACSVFALPSTHSLESFGYVQCEALLCGTPVVATSLPGVRRVIEVTKGGVLVQPNDSGALAGAIAEVFDHPGSFHVPRQRLLAYLDPKHSLDAYERVLGKR